MTVVREPFWCLLKIVSHDVEDLITHTTPTRKTKYAEDALSSLTRF